MMQIEEPLLVVLSWSLAALVAESCCFLHVGTVLKAGEELVFLPTHTHTLFPNLALARSSQAWLCSRGEPYRVTVGDCVHIVLRCHMPVPQPPHSSGEFRILAKGVWAGRIIKLEYCFRAGPHARSCSNAQVCSFCRAHVNCARGQAAAHLVVRIFEEGTDGQMVHHSTGFFNEGCQCYSGREAST